MVPDGYAETLNGLIEWVYKNHEWGVLPIPVARALALQRMLAAAAPTTDAFSLLTEVAACFTRDDDLPNDLLSRIDASISAHAKETL